MIYKYLSTSIKQYLVKVLIFLSSVCNSNIPEVTEQKSVIIISSEK